MRILYFILFFTLKYALWIVYPRRKTVNAPKNFFGRTIFVSNHPASFMDPLTVASLQRPIVFFMTRSDVFTKITKPFLWACHMLPIYRQLDGGDTRSKNDKIFKKASKILSNGRNLLIFGEGFTDDVFIRRLKPVKKGAVKIGFATLEKMNWKKKVYMVAVGANYSDPNQMRSDILISNSERICLNDYREDYEQNPMQVIAQITSRLEKLMQEQLTHVARKDDAPFHENMMVITRRGMNATSFDKSLSLLDRWKYSRQLALWLNEQNVEENEKLSKLKADLAGYFSLIKRMRLTDPLIHWKKTNGGKSTEIAAIIFLFPFMIIGMIHCFIPYYFVKNFAEKSFKRKVFWSSVKMVMGKISIGLLNIPYIFLFYYFVYPSWWLAIGYYATIGLTGLAAYQWFSNFKSLKAKGIVAKTDISKIIKKRDELENRIAEIVPDIKID